ncbi:MAG TPA: c-type cytochrome [Stellaceae bacterium]|nr:c-type cytochrome [Stellaceae bacterium]
MEALDRAWRLWVGIILAGMVVTACVLGFVVVPLVQGGGPGFDAFTAICRAIGINLAPREAPRAAAPAQPASGVAWNSKTFGALAHGDKAAGAKFAQDTCIACHAPDGPPPDPSIPRLAGQSSFAIYKQLQDFKSSTRINEIMSGLAKAMTDTQIADVAAYYSSLARLDLDARHPAFAGPEIEALVERGDATRGVPPCASCHAATSGGPIETPTLTGQSPQYVAAALKDFAEGQRRNDIYGRMRGIAAKLTPAEMTLLGDYYTTPH